MPIGESLGRAVLELVTDNTKLERGLTDAEKRTQQIGKRMQQVGGALTLGLTLPIVAAGAASVKAAADLAESMNAINVVFGDASDIVEEYGRTAAESIGLTQTAFNRASTTLGAMLQNVGLAAEDAANQTIDLAARAADMASVLNTSVDQALGAIQAGIRGEIDPLERFGVSLNAAAVEAHAMAEGIANGSGELSNQEKVLARVSLIMEQTSKFAGDFSNTQDQLANSTRVTWAQIQQLAAELGQHLLPVVEKVMGFVRSVVERFSGLSETSQKLILILAGVAAAIGPIISVIGTLTAAFGTMNAVLSIGVIGGILTLVSLAVLVIENWDPIAAFFVELWNKVVEAFRRVIDWLRNVFMKVWNFVMDAVLAYIDAYVGAVEGIGRFLGFDVSGIEEFRAKVQATGESMKMVADESDQARENIAGSAEEAAAATGEYRDQVTEVENVTTATGERLEVEEEITEEMEKQVSLQKELVDGIRDQLQRAAAETRSVLLPQWEQLRDVAETTFGDARAAVAQKIVSLVEGLTPELAIQEQSAEGLKAWQQELLAAYEEAKAVLEETNEEEEKRVNKTKELLTLRKQQLKNARELKAAMGAAGEAGGGPGVLAQGMGEAFGGSQVAGAISGALSPASAAADALSAIAESSEHLNAVLNPITTTFRAMGEVIGPLLDQALMPLVRHMVRFGSMLGQLIVPILQVLAPILDAFYTVIDAFLMPIFRMLAIVITYVLAPFRYLADLLGWFGNMVRYAIGKLTFWTSEDNIERPTFSSTAFSGIEGRVAEIRGFDAGPGTLAGDSGGGVGGGPGGAVEQKRPINVEINIRDNEIAGEDGFEQLAMIIRTEFDRMGVVNA